MLSVIVVTRNRKDLLEMCLNSLFLQSVKEKVEIIVIDNCSLDGTKEFLKKIPADKLKLIENKQQSSLWACKNKGVQEASADMIAFTDDDCVASVDWLANIKSSLNSYDFAAGSVLALPETKLPWWWRRSLNWLIGINPCPGRRSLPLGSNIAFKKQALEKIISEKGPLADEHYPYLPYGEDNYRTKKALKSGLSMTINTAAIVYHYIPQERLKLSWLIKRSLQEGRALTYYEKGIGELLFSLISWPIDIIRLIIFLDLNRLFRMMTKLSYLVNFARRDHAGER